MKVCQVLASRGEGGLERHFIDLCNGLADRHQVVAVAHRDFRRHLSPKVIHEPMDLSGWRYNPLTLISLARRLRRHRADIVHAQASKAAAMTGAIRHALGAAGLVATVHNIKRDKRVYRRFDRVIAVSRRTAAQLGHDRVDVVFNGLARAAAQACATAAAGAGREKIGPTALTAGRLVPAKGFDVLLRAWRGLDGRLVIAGAGPQRPALEGMIRELGLRDNVTLLGHREDMPELLAGADLVIIASRKEGFPYFLLESLFAGKVVISTRVPGAEDVLPEEFLVDPGDSGALHSRIARVLAAPDAAHRAFEPVWARALEEFTLERMAAQTESVYRRILGR